ncbi:ABC transporter permease [Rhodococcus sp. ACS1]|uniref:ABC transporter permease n=1 Tax=Rhodococcus sp. ACS1 TaxID=2028570 RepID=UPI000BB13A2E|nr:ABC transporter permease [Rhodococcus sp. ACS1]PBC39548.1 ABC transporter permease [Rhodococcus sp. ACS1]
MATTLATPPARAGGRARRRSVRDLSGYVLLLPLLGLVGAALIIPLGFILIRSFQDPSGSWTFDVYQQIAASDIYRRSLVNTLVISTAVTVICLVLGYLVAHRMATRWARFAPVVAGLLLLSFWTGLLIRTFAWMILLGKNGVFAAVAEAVGVSNLPQMLYNPAGAIVGMVNIMLPYMALTLYSTMQRVDDRTMTAAASLGARPIVAFWRIYVPATLPGIAAGCLLVFVITLGFYITPELLGGPETVMISQRVAKVVQQLLDFQLAGALSLVLLVVSLGLLALYNRLFSLKNLRGL